MSRPEVERMKQGVTAALRSHPTNELVRDFAALIEYVERLETAAAGLVNRLGDHPLWREDLAEVLRVLGCASRGSGPIPRR